MPALLLKLQRNKEGGLLQDIWAGRPDKGEKKKILLHHQRIIERVGVDQSSIEERAKEAKVYEPRRGL